MEIQKVIAVYFSPGGCVRKITREIASKVCYRLSVMQRGGVNARTILAHGGDMPYGEGDFTLPEARKTPFRAGKGDLVVVGMPVYAGRLPNLLVKYLEGWEGAGAYAVPVVVYGNRSYGNSLSELRGILLGKGFLPVAAAAFVGEHSFAPRLAAGRPDAEDMAAAEAFATEVAQRVAGKAATAEHPPVVEVPGEPAPGYGGYYQPLGEDGTPVRFLKAKPVTSDACTRCGHCAEVCPMGAIDRERPAEVPGICIKCNACIRECPAGAKKITDAAYLSHVRYLESHYAATRAAVERF